MQTVRAEEVAIALERVYARPEFADSSTPWLLQKLGDLWNALLTWLAGILWRPELFAGWSPIVIRIVIGLLLLIAAASALFLVGRAASIFLSSRSLMGRWPTPEGVDGGVAHWEAEARRAEAEGRLRDAAMALYHVAILHLQAGGALRFQAGKTPDEYRREARADPNVAQAFDRIVRHFLPLAFGPNPPDARLLGALRTAVGEVSLRG